MHDDAARGRAPLAGRTDRAEDDRRYDELHVGVFVDDDGVVAAQFEQDFAHAFRDLHTDLAADRGRAGKRDQVDARVIDELLREFVAAVVDQAGERRQIEFGDSLVDDLLHGDPAQGRFR